MNRTQPDGRACGAEAVGARRAGWRGRWAWPGVPVAVRVLTLGLGLVAVGLVTGCGPSAGPAGDSGVKAVGSQGADKDQDREPPVIDGANLDPAMARLVAEARAAVLADRRAAAGWGRLGQVLHTLEFTAEARVCYERAAALAPDVPRWAHLLGLLRLQDDPDAGLVLLRRAAALAKGQPDASEVRLAQALVERGQWEEAGPVLDALQGRRPDHPVAALERARISLARQQLPQAEASLAVALTNAFTRRAALLLQGQVRQRQGDGAVAARLTAEAGALPRPLDWPDPYLREVQALRVDRSQAADQINGLLVQGRLAEAATRLDRLLAAAPNEAEGLLLLGRLRYLEKRCREAEEALRRHLDVQEQSVNGWMQLSLALLCQERWADGATALRRVLALKPEFAPAHANLGYALARGGDSAGAILAYREVLRLSPGNAEAHFALAEELGLSGRTEEALTHLERAAALSPGDPRLVRLRERLARSGAR